MGLRLGVVGLGLGLVLLIAWLRGAEPGARDSQGPTLGTPGKALAAASSGSRLAGPQALTGETAGAPRRVEPTEATKRRGPDLDELEGFRPRTILSFRLRSSDGQLVTRGQMRMRVGWGSRSLRSWRQSNLSGNETIQISIYDRNGISPHSLEVEWKAGPLQLRERVERDLPTTLEAGTLDLGVLDLTPMPVTAAGWVVFPDGRPVHEARVTLQDGVGAELEHDPAVTDEAGAFAIQALEPVDSGITLRAEKQDLAAYGPVAAVPGQDDVTLVLHPQAHVRVQLLLDPAVNPKDLLVRARGEPDGELRRGRAVAPTPQAGVADLLVSGLAPGPCTVEVLYRGQEAPLATVSQVLARTSTEAWDARLAPLDLRGRFCIVDLVVLRSDGTSPLKAEVSYRSADEPSAPWRSKALRKGRGRLVLHGTAMDLEVSCDEHRPQRIEGVAGSQTVTLEPGYPLHLQLVNVPDEALRGKVRAVLRAPGLNPGDTRRLYATFDPAGRTRVVAPLAATWEVEVTLTPASGGRPRTFDLGALALRDSPEPQVHRLEVPSFDPTPPWPSGRDF